MLGTSAAVFGLDELKETSITFERSCAATRSRCKNAFTTTVLGLPVVARLSPVTLSSAPSLPVIDSFVLNNVGLKLPSVGSADRVRLTCVVYESLRQHYSAFLRSDSGRVLVREFRCYYPAADITELKMVDLVLWQRRG